MYGDGKTTYYLASNLSETIDGVYLYPKNLLCPKIVRYTSNSADTNNLNYSCSSGFVNYVIVDRFAPSSSSNKIVFEQFLQGGTGGATVSTLPTTTSTTLLKQITSTTMKSEFVWTDPWLDVEKFLQKEQVQNISNYVVIEGILIVVVMVILYKYK